MKTRKPTLEEALAYPGWEPVFTEEPDGTFKCEVRPLFDLVLYAASREELEADWKEALETHLQAYIDTDKCIPMPRVALQDNSPAGGYAEETTNEDLGDYSNLVAA